MSRTTESIFRALPSFPWLDPCPRCGFRESCDCTVLERARFMYPGLRTDAGGERGSRAPIGLREVM